MQLTTAADVSHGGDLEMGRTWLSHPAAEAKGLPRRSAVTRTIDRLLCPGVHLLACRTGPGLARFVVAPGDLQWWLGAETAISQNSSRLAHRRPRGHQRGSNG